MPQMELGALPLANAGVRPDGVQPMSQGVQNGPQPVETTEQVHGVTTIEKHSVFSAICPPRSSALVDWCFSGWDCALDRTLGQVTCDARLGPGWERRRLPCCWGKERRLGCKAEERNRDKADQTSSFISWTSLCTGKTRGALNGRGQPVLVQNTSISAVTERRRLWVGLQQKERSF